MEHPGQYRCAAATDADLYVLQDESNTTNLSAYDSLYTSSAAQARAANSAVKVYSEVSTANGTADRMTAAAQSISPDGFYVAAPGATAQPVLPEHEGHWRLTGIQPAARARHMPGPRCMRARLRRNLATD